MRIGARVRLTTIGTVVQTWAFNNLGKSHVSISRESDGFRNIAMLDDSQLEEVEDETGAVPDRDWRDVCADMIRLEHDEQAIELLREKSPVSGRLKLEQQVNDYQDRLDVLEDVLVQARYLLGQIGRNPPLENPPLENAWRRLEEAVRIVMAKSEPLPP